MSTDTSSQKHHQSALRRKAEQIAMEVSDLGQIRGSESSVLPLSPPEFVTNRACDVIK